MESRTKLALSESTVRRLFAAAGISEITDIAVLGAGEFNAVYAAKGNKQAYVLKVAPGIDIPVLHYEQGMMRAEVFWYSQMREHTDIRVPEVYYTDFSHQLIPADWFIMERLPGEQLDQIKLSAGEKAAVDRRLAQMVAAMHKISGERFGYVQNELYADWYAALHAMTENLLHDARAKGKRSKRGERLLGLEEKYRTVLSRAECTMVNFDIWAPNILCRRTENGMECMWIDPERCFWGDRIADFFCLEFGAPLKKKAKTLAAYNAAAKTPIRVTRDEQIRYALMLGYAALIMETEKYYRYTPRHFGWWRNVAASFYLYQSAFRELRAIEHETQ